MLPLFDNRRPNQDSNLDALAGRDLCHLTFFYQCSFFFTKKETHSNLVQYPYAIGAFVPQSIRQSREQSELCDWGKLLIEL